MAIRVQGLSDGDPERLRTMARSRRLGARLVRRAQIVLHSVEGLTAPAISGHMELCGATVRHWLKRFKARGFAGLEEDVRSGRPPTYSAAERSAVIDTALTPPADGRTLDATVVGRDSGTNLALLKVEDAGALPHLRWGDSKAVQMGDWAVAVGRASPQEGRLAVGVISAPPGALVRTDADYGRGFAGGPLLTPRVTRSG